MKTGLPVTPGSVNDYCVRSFRHASQDLLNFIILLSLFQSAIAVEITDESEKQSPADELDRCAWVLQLLIAGRLVNLVAVDCVYFCGAPTQTLPNTPGTIEYLLLLQFSCWQSWIAL